MQFADLRLAEPILRALVSEGYSTATPIQAQAIPPILEKRDVLGIAQTGTGKTAAFALPILHHLCGGAQPVSGSRKPRCLVLAPTRELATQIADGFRAYGQFLKLRQTVIFGGVGHHSQIQALRNGIDIIVATPGRLLDLINQRHVPLEAIEFLVLDEADRMLDMGFVHDIRRIAQKLPATRQTMLFSATMPAEIRQLAGTLMRNPATVQVAAVSAPAERIDQSVYFVDRRNKPELLAHLVNETPMSRAIVFTRTKHGADRVVRHLHARGIRAEAIHGNKSQNARERALKNFRASKIPVLVATDIASRGIDIDDISHVVNYDLTHEPETYVHRIGRTARAGASGSAVSFCDQDERGNLRAIERLIRRQITVKTDHPQYAAQPESEPRMREDHGPRPEHRHENRRSHGNPKSHHASRFHHKKSKPARPQAQGGSANATEPRRANPAPAKSRQSARPVHTAHAGAAPRSRPSHRHPLFKSHRSR